ncbi:MAG TPA: DUF2249 domain-containing protein [Verrucomicrobiae bacterium]|nr:DUF2249 domain-containing protein [Verrucomicrobiae bacterium]
MNKKTVTLDVRDDIRCGREPFSKIMKAAAAMQADESLLLIAPFEPVPLFRVLEKQGFVHDGQATESGDWEIRFTRQSGATPTEAALASSPVRQSNGIAPAPAQIVEVDARGLEPPQPMIKILEALVALPAGAELRARTERRPMHLYPHLEERGFTAATEEQSDGSFLTHISR